MKVIMQIVCGEDKFDRGEQMICGLWKGAHDDDIINANICIVAPHKEVTYDGEE